MIVRATPIIAFFYLSAALASATTTRFVDEIVAENQPIVQAIDRDNLEQVASYLVAGHSPFTKIKNKLQERLLDRAAAHGSAQSFELLLRAANERQKDVEIRDARGTPTIVTLSSMAIPGNTATAKYESMIALMLSLYPESAKSSDGAYIGDGRTALHEAAAVGNLKLAQMLIARGAQVNAKNSSGETPLHLAARFGHIEVAQFLMRSGALINEKSKYTHTTPLMAAAEMGHENMIRKLIAAGAERNAKDVFGKTAPQRFKEYAAEYSESSARKLTTQNATH